MKKIVRISESKLIELLRSVLNEQSFPGTSSLENMGYRQKRQEPLPTVQPKKTVENINPNNLKFGAKDKPGDTKGPVHQLQQTLIDKGFLILRKGPTGYFGELTQKALDRANAGTKTTTQKTVTKQTGEKIKDEKPSKYQFTPRIDQELKYIDQRGLGDSPFFIYDPKDNLLFLFENTNKFVAKTQVVDGADVQKEIENAEPFSMEDWCKVSGLDSTPHLCTDPKTKEKAKGQYAILAKLQQRFLPKGIYKISSLGREEGYVGSGQNVWRLKDAKTGKLAAGAIHGLPNLPERLKASADLEKYLKSEMNSNQVPQEYLNAVKTITKANQSFGCVGVPANFVENPQVKNILETGDKWYKKSVKVFVMGDKGQDFLVQNSVKFFDNLSSDGQACVNPESLANKMSTMA